MEKTSFYSCAYAKYENEIIRQNRESDPKECQESFLANLKCFPNFPDIDLISALSYENYERKACKVNLVFLPFETLCIKTKRNPLIFSYADKTMTFETDHLRLIRKISESSDNNHALVLCCNKSGIYCFKGIINLSKIDKAFSDYYLININGYAHWSARCKNFDLFDFENGKFCDFNKKCKDFKVQAEAVKDCLMSCAFKIDLNSLQNILEIINKQNNGFSFVIFKDKQKAIDESKRLCEAQRGFEPEKPLKRKELVKCIPQFTKVDGGLLLDSSLTCYAYGCIYDGVVPKYFKGSLANGSRFNSTALYTYNLNNPKNKNKRSNTNQKSTVCLGVVFSDDGGLKIAKI